MHELTFLHPKQEHVLELSDVLEEGSFCDI